MTPTLGLPWWAIFVAIAAGTFVSEDLTVISTGILIGKGQIQPLLGLFACFSGIFIGDVLLWALGRFLRSFGDIFGLHRFIPGGIRARAAWWFQAHGGKTIMLSRFVPGSRFVTYVAAGMAGPNALQFMKYAALVGLIWSPAILLLSAFIGPGMVDIVGSSLHNDLVGFGISFLLLLFFVRFLTLLPSEEGRFRIRAFWSRLTNHEFWPAWIFYIPGAFYIAYLAFRYRSIMLFATANPGIPFGGMVGESKYDIIEKLDKKKTIPSLLIHGHNKFVGHHKKNLLPARRDAHLPNNSNEKAMLLLKRWMGTRKIRYPLILKPDAAQRGAGVKKVRNDTEARLYLEAAEYDVLVQPFHPGPQEAGVLYYRFPGEREGHIHSIVSKVFPVIYGDGTSTLRELIYRHPRFRTQAWVFLTRFAEREETILPAGQAFPLTLAGNHAQGTMFVDGSRLITERLTRALDRVVANFPGFYIGRFDLKYSEVEELKGGTGFTVLELNGSLGEPTSMYDPTRSYLWALGVQTSHLKLLFQIGAANRDRGVRPPSLFEVIRQVFTYYRKRRIDPISD